MVADKPLIVDGVKVSVTAEDFDDFDVLEAIADVNAHEGDSVTQLSDVVRLFRMVFKGDYERIKRELRARHDGKLTAKTMTDFFNAVGKAAQAKN